MGISAMTPDSELINYNTHAESTIVLNEEDIVLPERKGIVAISAAAEIEKENDRCQKYYGGAPLGGISAIVVTTVP